MILGGVASALLLFVVAVVAISIMTTIHYCQDWQNQREGWNLDQTRAFRINCFNINRFKPLVVEKNTDEA